MVTANMIRVEVAFANSQRQYLVLLEVESGSTLQSVIDRSGVLTEFPEIDFERHKVGIFSQQKNLYDTVQSGDRIEIYRPLQVDPKVIRKLRAKKQI